MNESNSLTCLHKYIPKILPLSEDIFANKEQSTAITMQTLGPARQLSALLAEDYKNHQQQYTEDNMLPPKHLQHLLARVTWTCPKKKYDKAKTQNKYPFDG